MNFNTCWIDIIYCLEENKLSAGVIKYLNLNNLKFLENSKRLISGDIIKDEF